MDSLSPTQTAQCSLPLRHGGLGYRRAADTADAAMLGGYACAAHLGYGVGQMDDSLAACIADPDAFGHLDMIASLQDAWRRVILADRHLRTLAKAVAVGHTIFTGAKNARADVPMPDAEAKYDELWRKDFITGGTPEDQSYASDKFDDDLANDIDAALQPGHDLSTERVEMATHPENHLGIISLLCETPWVKDKWPLQKLIDRSMSRTRFKTFWRSLPTVEEQLRIRAQLNPLANIPLRALPSVPLNKLNDSQFMWIIRDRLGMRHPEADGLDKCGCGKPLKGGRHFRRCQQGGGNTFVHDCVRDVIAAMHRHAGVVVQVEPEGMLPGTRERPADINAIEMGSQRRDLAIDTAVVDSQEVRGDSDARRCALTTGTKPRTYIPLGSGTVLPPPAAHQWRIASEPTVMTACPSFSRWTVPRAGHLQHILTNSVRLQTPAADTTRSTSSHDG